MLSAKKGRLDLTFIPNVKASSVSVLMGWKLPSVNWFVLDKLKRGQPCGCPDLSHGSEITTCAYSVYQYAHSKLMGDAKAQQSSKAAYVGCGFHNDEFFICVKTAGTFSAIRKVVSELMKSLTPEKLYPVYSANIRILNGKPDRSEFNYCANEIRKSMNDITCLVIGKAKLDKGKVQAICDKGTEKYNDGKAAEPSVKPSSLSKEKGKSSFPTLKSKGMGAPLVADFIESNSHERAIPTSGMILVYNEKWSAPKSLDKKKIDNWVKQKYGKLTDLGSSLLFLAVSECNINPTDGIVFAKKDVKSSDVANMIKEAF